MLGNQGNVQSNIICTYSQSRASKEVSETHHMCLLMVTCDKINELTCGVRNINPLLKGRRLRWPKCFESAVAKVRMHKVMHLLFEVHLRFEHGILPIWQGHALNSFLAPRCLLLLHSLSIEQDI